MGGADAGYWPVVDLSEVVVAELGARDLGLPIEELGVARGSFAACCGWVIAFTGIVARKPLAHHSITLADDTMQAMRTTLTLTPAADALIRKAMRERGISFKEAVNTAIVEGLSVAGGGREFRTPTFDLGPARAPIERALRVAAELEDEELLRKASVGK